ncbi:TPA: site-specific DNA-methyltransferase [Enterococcus faecalis]
MQIEKMKLSDLKAADYNPRVDLKPGMQEYEKLKQSILEFGFVDPPIYNIQTGNLVGGHQRVAVAKELGLFNEIEVSVVDLSLDKEKALNVALNKISGRWDEEKLSILLNELDDEAVNLTGFDTEEVDGLLASFNYEEDIEKPIIEDDFQVNEFIENHHEAKTKLGQLWKLGNHYLLCGDATKPSDVEKLLQGKKANLVVTDPPYNVAVKSDNKELNESGREKIMNAAGIFVRSQCIWVKNNATFGWSQYRWQHEPVFYAHKKKQAPVWYGDRKQTTVWQDDLLEDLPATIWKVPRDDVATYYHPTQKPLSLIAIPVRNSSKRQDIVLDLFGGSGSTLMTCEQLNRICYTLELDPLFCDVIIERFEKSTGIIAELVE